MSHPNRSFRIGKLQLRRSWILLFAMYLAPSLRAMNMRTYDITSLVYLSTDIVIANLSEDAQHQFTATVTETLYGGLHPGDKLTTLTPFLTFFRPMKDGMRVILFLDSRPRQYDFLNKGLEKSPYAIPPSGVYLIDEYEHVHGYLQMDNPGPYVAWGYGSMLEKGKVPTKVEDLAFPSLAEEKTLIADAIRSVATVRALLDKSATRADVPVLLDLIDSSPARSDRRDLRQSGAIHDRVREQLHSLNDPTILLRMHALAGDAQNLNSFENFIEPTGKENRNAFAAERVRFLIAQLADRKKDLKARLAALRILLGVSSYSHPYSGTATPLPIDGPPFAGSAEKVRAVCRDIFDDESQDANLRGLCLEFLLDRAAEQANARRVFAGTRSATLKFLIEECFLDRSDDLYNSLHAPSGAAASIMVPIRSCNGNGFCACGEKPSGQPVFLAEYHTRKDISVDGTDAVVFTHLQSRRQYSIHDPHLLNYSNGGQMGWEMLSIPDLKDIPPGDYVLSYSVQRGDAVVSNGFGTPVSVRETPSGKQLIVNTKSYPEVPLGWGW